MDGNEIIPIVGIVMTMLIPIIAILTYHQRKMAELIHGQRNERPLPQSDQEAEIRTLKQLLHQQAIEIDDLKKALGTRTTDDEISRRVSGA